MRFINKQQHKMSCGPTAIANALKWLDCSCSYRKMLKSMGSSEWTLRKGMYNQELESVMRDYDVPFSKAHEATILRVENALNKGHAVILNFKWYRTFDGIEKSHRHYVFIHGYTNDAFGICNEGKTGNLKETFRNFFARSKKEDKPARMWIIKK